LQAGQGCASCGKDSEKLLDAAASITIVELVRGCGVFKVVEPPTVQDSNNNPHLPNISLNAGQPNTIYILNPELQWCTHHKVVFGDF
jgi:hypothetical protein